MELSRIFVDVDVLASTSGYNVDVRNFLGADPARRPRDFEVHLTKGRIHRLRDLYRVTLFVGVEILVEDYRS